MSYAYLIAFIIVMGLGSQISSYERHTARNTCINNISQKAFDKVGNKPDDISEMINKTCGAP